MGLSLGLCQLAPFVNGWVLPLVHDEYGLGDALAVGLGVCVFSLFAGYILCCLDKRAEKKAKEAGFEQDEGITCRDITSFGLSFWLLAFTAWFIYMSVFPYLENVSELLQKKYQFPERIADLLFGVPYVVAAFVTPLIGLVADNRGRRVQFIMISNILLITAFLTSMYLPSCPEDEGTCYQEFIPLLLVGIGFAIYIGVFWGSIPLTVPPHVVGTAFGICLSFKNMALSYAPWQITILEDMKQDSNGEGVFYLGADLFYIGSNVIGLLLAFSLFCWDRYQCDGRLNTPEKDYGEYIDS